MEESKKAYLEAAAKLKTTEAELQALVKKFDELESQTASLNAKVAARESEEKTVYDSYFLGKATEKDLADIRRKSQNAKDAISSHSKMLESLNRCIAGKDREISALRKQIDSLRHQVWSCLFETRAAAIPETVKIAVKELITIGLNCAIGRDWILPKIFPLPSSGEIQSSYKRLSSELNIE